MKHIPPLQVFASLLTFSLFTCIFAALAITYDVRKFNPWAAALLVFGLACLVLQAVFTYKVYHRTKDIQADEYTTALLHKASYYTLMLVSFLISMMFIASSVLITLQGAEGKPLGSILSVKLVLGLFALIQLTGLTSFLLFYSLNDRKNKNGLDG